ncbi:hypothetical protein QTP88_025090 [Uroleucon formosanum]
MNNSSNCGIEECKKKWSSVRDQFRRTLQKRKTASGQAAVNNQKYKYEDILEFILPHISERDTLFNVDDFEEDQNNEITNDETPEEFSGQTYEPQNNRDRSNKSITEIQNNFTDSVDDTLRSTTETLAKASSVSVKKNTFRPPLKRKIIHEGKSIDSPASQLMAFMLAEKEEENKKSKKEVESTVKHPIDAFLSGIAPTLKTLNPILQNQAKSAIFSITQEFEMKQLMYSNEQNVHIPINPNNIHELYPIASSSQSQFDSTTSLYIHRLIQLQV